MPTKQEIIDQREALHAKGFKAYSAAREAYEATIGEELAALKAECGATGHVFSTERNAVPFAAGSRICVYCGTSKPTGG